MYFSRIDLAALAVLPSGFFFSFSPGRPPAWILEELAADDSPSFGGVATSITVLPSGTSADGDVELGLSPSRERSKAAMSSSAPFALGASSVFGGGVGDATGLEEFPPADLAAAAARAADDLVGGAGVGRLTGALASRRTENSKGPTLSWSS
jgi:hypothetical protein